MCSTRQGDRDLSVGTGRQGDRDLSVNWMTKNYLKIFIEFLKLL
ncbi:MAG: hypothetical protein HPY66_0576 [Firmicutes bacterium]|nr:hypothetical protein [Bacillota bacterium]